MAQRWGKYNIFQKKGRNVEVSAEIMLVESHLYLYLKKTSTLIIISRF